MKDMQNIRNFCIISHIDHGKSTLADRFLEITKTIEKKKMQPQYLDMMELERERGITIKLQPCRMVWQTPDHSEFILNLIDTPGHVDFSYEVSRSLAAVEGAILLVDAVKGIQAQTLANLNLAKKQNLVIIPVINKIDLAQARVEQITKDLAALLKVNKDKVIKISAKYGTNIELVLQAIIAEIPCPMTDSAKPLRALIFDSKYDSYKGVIAYVRLVDGKLSKQEKIYLIRAQISGEAKELGYFKPGFSPQNILRAGEIGYIATGVKSPGKVRVGDTITSDKLFILNNSVEPLAGYQEPKPMIFADIYPEDSNNYDFLKNALEKLRLTDASLTFATRTKTTLGRGFHCGFLGMLHLEIVSQRLRREFGLNVKIANPTVIYKIIDKKGQGFFISSVTDWPEQSQIQEIQEPWIKLEVLIPQSYLGNVSELLKNLKGKYVRTEYLGSDSILLIYEAPLRGVIVNFYDALKSSTQGYGSMNYEFLGYKRADLVKIDILIAGEREQGLSKIAARDSAFQEGSLLVKKLKEILPPQQFKVALQAMVQGKIIARETISHKRKDVIAHLYGGDYTRKRKLLEKQKKRKKALEGQSKVKIPPEVYLRILS
jgi:GTP-binding protein LepA